MAAELPLSRRERARQDKWVRIREAARELFGQQGFEVTTMRQIAERADIGLGTIYSYVDSKYGLLDAISGDDLARVLNQAFAGLKPDQPVIMAVRQLFAAIFAHHAQDPDFAREVFKELTFAEDARRAERGARFQSFVGQLTGLLAQAQARGEIAAGVDCGAAAMSLFGLHFFALTVTLAERQPVAQAQGLFEMFLQQLVQGLQPLETTTDQSKRRKKS